MTTQKLKKKNSLSALFFGIWLRLSPKRRTQLFLLFLVMLASGGAELVSLGAVLPFLAILSDPNILLENSYVKYLLNYLGLTQSSHLLIFATLVFVLAAIFAASIRLVNLWLNGRLAAAIGSDLSCEAYARTLYQPYETHLHRNSADIITGTTSQVGRMVAAITALLQMCTFVLVTLSLLIGLILLDWVVALSALSLFVTLYLILGLTARKELNLNSKKIAQVAKLQIKALQEGLGTIRDVLLDSNQELYVDIYRKADGPLRQLQAKNQFLGAFPRYVFEAIGLICIALLGCFLVSQRGPGGSAITLLGALALGAQRLLPSLQQIYANWSRIKSCEADLESVFSMLNQPIAPTCKNVQPINFSLLNCSGVVYRYNPSSPSVLSNCNLSIKRGERIGLIGSTGSGKSTLVDLLMGLLVPTEGNISVNGFDLHASFNDDKLKAWRSSISHVPQNIYLCDASIAENIAFGVKFQDIDFDRVRHVANLAQISSFIESTDLGYETSVGERGVRLSGGQKQRIGIARALYKKSDILVLDEATSALDSITEEAVIKSVESLSQRLTIIMIAHRLSTLRRCNRIIRLEEGIITKDGHPREILTDFS